MIMVDSVDHVGQNLNFSGISGKKILVTQFLEVLIEFFVGKSAFCSKNHTVQKFSFPAVFLEFAVGTQSITGLFGEHNLFEFRLSVFLSVLLLKDVLLHLTYGMLLASVFSFFYFSHD